MSAVTESYIRPLSDLGFFFKYQYVPDTFPFFIGIICILTIDYYYIHVKGAFVWYIFLVLIKYYSKV